VINNEEADDYITEVLDGCVWRKATSVDGKVYWATNNTGGIGEPIQGGNFKFRHMGDYLLLAPMDEHVPDDPEARAKAIRQYIRPSPIQILLIELEQMMLVSLPSSKAWQNDYSHSIKVGLNQKTNRTEHSKPSQRTQQASLLTRSYKLLSSCNWSMATK
jgi:hypothetical protein